METGLRVYCSDKASILFFKSSFYLSEFFSYIVFTNYAAIFEKLLNKFFIRSLNFFDNEQSNWE